MQFSQSIYDMNFYSETKLVRSLAMRIHIHIVGRFDTLCPRSGSRQFFAGRHVKWVKGGGDCGKNRDKNGKLHIESAKGLWYGFAGGSNRFKLNWNANLDF